MRKLGELPGRLVKSTRDDRALTAVVFAYLALLPIQFQISPLLRIAPADIVLALGLLVVAGRMEVPPHLVGFWHGALLTLFAASALGTLLVNGEVSAWAVVNKTIGFAALLAAYLAVGNLARDFSKLLEVLHFFIGSVAVYNLLSSAAFLLGFELLLLNSQPDLERLAGGLHDPNAYGGLLVVCLVCYAAFRASPARRFSAFFDRVVIVSLTLGIVLTLSRSAWMALGVSLAGLIILQKNRRAAVAGAVGVAMIALLGAGLVDADSRVLELSLRVDTVQERMALNDAAIRETTLNPLGMGLGGFQEEHGAIVHNTLLWFGADLGLLGVAAFLGLSLWVLRRLYVGFTMHSGARRDVIIGLGVAHLAMLTMSLAIEAFYQRHWWVVMALIAAATSQQALSSEP